MLTATLSPAAETVAAWVLILCAVVWIVSDRLVAALCWLDRNNAETDTIIAADYGEPTREQVEWDMHVADAIRLTEADTLAERSWDELEFAASVLADIDDLPGGGSVA